MQINANSPERSFMGWRELVRGSSIASDTTENAASGTPRPPETPPGNRIDANSPEASPTNDPNFMGWQEHYGIYRASDTTENACLVRAIAKKHFPDFRFQRSALLALQEGCETFLVDLLVGRSLRGHRTPRRRRPARHRHARGRPERPRNY
jgi:hypothetical protein